MNKHADSKSEAMENQVGELDPSGFIRITGEATGLIEMGEHCQAIEVIGSPLYSRIVWE